MWTEGYSNHPVCVCVHVFLCVCLCVTTQRLQIPLIPSELSGSFQAVCTRRIHFNPLIHKPLSLAQND